jgi:hypothetical protein
MPEGTVPALVDAATFAAVQERMALNKRLSGRRNGDRGDAPAGGIRTLWVLRARHGR